MAEKSKVYYTSFRVRLGQSPLEKLKKLLKAAGLPELPLQNKFAAIKIHFGEDGNLSYLRPNYARVVAEMLKDLGAYPFLTDCNTLYKGSRRNALDHLDCALRNGFGCRETGCNVLIADGLKGKDEVSIPVEGGVYCQNALIGQAIMDADVIISLNHVKGHEATGFGGALKNLGMGCGSVAGKREMHCDGMPTVDEQSCIGCGVCANTCAFGAIHMEPNAGGKGRHALVDHQLCMGCHRCVSTCMQAAIQGKNSSDEMLCRKIAEYARAVTQNRPQFHINIITDVSPNCDCYGGNDMPIIAPVGMFASMDPVALDTASYDACNQAPRIPGSIMDERENTGDLFRDLFPNVDGHITLEHGERIGLGSRDYELIEVK